MSHFIWKAGWLEIYLPVIFNWNLKNLFYSADDDEAEGDVVAVGEEEGDVVAVGEVVGDVAGETEVLVVGEGDLDALGVEIFVGDVVTVVEPW